MAVLWQSCGEGARILRVLGDSPCPVLPGLVAGRPVTEVGPYCFAAREIELRDGSLWPADSTDTHEVTGDFLEEAVLPDSVQVLHSAAFYNCHRLRRVEAGPGPGKPGQ